MQRTVRIMVALVILLSGLAIIPFVSLPTQAFRWQRYANAYQPTLAINHVSGGRGSFFRITGSGYPADTTVTVFVNGVLVGVTSTDDLGEVDVSLSTSQADLGWYVVVVMANPSAEIGFRLAAGEPLWPQEGGGPVFDVPEGIARHLVYLPIVAR